MNLMKTVFAQYAQMVLSYNWYDDIREELSEMAISLVRASDTLQLLDKFVFLMSADILAKYTAKACKLLLKRQK